MRAVGPRIPSSAANRPRAPWAIYIIFFLAGAGFLSLFLFAMGITTAIRARRWVQCPCTILSSKVTEVSGSKGPTYRVDAVYEYWFDGRKYRGDHYGVSTGSSSGYNGKLDTVRSIPPGKRTVCYVNPQAPTEAVIDRSIGWEVLFMLIPILFMVIGAAGFVNALRAGRQERGSRHALAIEGINPTATPLGLAPLPPGRGAITLRPKQAPWVALVAMGAFALVWNVVVFGVGFGFHLGRPHHIDACSDGILSLFGLIGIGLVLLVSYLALAMFNPNVTLVLAQSSVTPGQSVEMQWRIDGKSDRLDRLTFSLEGYEEAQFQRGTRSVTEQSLFSSQVLSETTNHAQMRAGQVTVTIPPNLVPTFSARHNRIIWSIKVHGQINHWPDLKQEFPITVTPAALEGGRA